MHSGAVSARQHEPLRSKFEFIGTAIVSSMLPQLWHHLVRKLLKIGCCAITLLVGL